MKSDMIMALETCTIVSFPDTCRVKRKKERNIPVAVTMKAAGNAATTTATTTASTGAISAATAATRNP